MSREGDKSRGKGSLCVNAKSNTTPLASGFQSVKGGGKVVWKSLG